LDDLAVVERNVVAFDMDDNADHPGVGNPIDTRSCVMFPETKLSSNSGLL
jgi:hypothetical protein